MKKFFALCLAVICLLSLLGSCAWAKLFDCPIKDVPASIECKYQGYPGHNGYDLKASYGTAIYAIFDGTIKYKVRYKVLDDGKKHSWDWGNWLELESSEAIDGDNYLMRVAHLSQFSCGYQVPSDIVCDNATPRNWDDPGCVLEEISTGTINVKKGQLIGYSGSCGNSTGPHLHIEIKKNGSYVNPDDYISSECFVDGSSNSPAGRFSED